MSLLPNIPAPLVLGPDTVGIISRTRTGSPDGLGEVTPTDTTTTIAGCRHRALSASETPEELTDISTQVWQTHLPAWAKVDDELVETSALLAKSTGQLTCNGLKFQQVSDPQIFTDDSSQPCFVKILSKREVG